MTGVQTCALPIFSTVREFSELRRNKGSGTCNSVPGWEATFTPITDFNDPDCTLENDYQSAGLSPWTKHGNGKNPFTFVETRPAWAQKYSAH